MLFSMSTHRTPACLAALALLTIVLAGCGSDGNRSAATTTYFLVAEIDPANGDSYIVPISDPTDIAHARRIIQDPDSVAAQILVCSIARGSGYGDYVNKDLVGGRTWSWHVSRFEGFAETTIEILDGGPTSVEENFDAWMQLTGGQIGFWSYTVKREVSLEEMR